jgi:hypothetical protein
LQAFGRLISPSSATEALLGGDLSFNRFDTGGRGKVEEIVGNGDVFLRLAETILSCRSVDIVNLNATDSIVDRNF